jgi:hypothetical protein
MANPSVSVDARGSWGTPAAQVVRDHRYDEQPKPPAYQQGCTDRDHDGDCQWPHPVVLSGARTFGRSGRVDMVPPGGAYRSLRLSEVSGRTFIKQVEVQFGNSSWQTINVDRTLVDGQSISLDLTGNVRAVKHVIVYGGNARERAEYRHQGAFTVTAV